MSRIMNARRQGMKRGISDDAEQFGGTAHFRKSVIASKTPDRRLTGRSNGISHPAKNYGSTKVRGDQARPMPGPAVCERQHIAAFQGCEKRKYFHGISRVVHIRGNPVQRGFDRSEEHTSE